MESSVRAFRRNLEPFEDDRLAPPWHIAGYNDLVSERRYLVSWAPLEAAFRAEADVFAFRCDSAAAIVPEACLPALEVATPNGRVEILTPYAAPLSSARLDDAGIAQVLSSVADTLARLDAHAYYAAALHPDTVALDEGGRVVVLPAAYAFPPDAFDAQRNDPDAARARGRAAHLAGFATLADRLAAGASPALASRLRSLAAERNGGRVTTLDQARALVLGEPPAPGARQAPPPDSIDVAEVVRAIGGGEVVAISGPAGTGRTTALARVLAALRTAGVEAHLIDEWDAAGTPARRKGAGKEAGARGGVWLVDDIDDRPLLHALVLEHAGEMERRPASGLVITTRSGAGAESPLVGLLENRAPHGVRRLELAVRSGPRPVPPDLDALGPEARQILELLAVASIPLPLDVVLAVFPGADRDLQRTIHALAGANLVVVECRRLPPAGALSIALRVPGASLRRHVVDHIPDPRRKNLHRTIARMGEARRAFAAMFVYDHLARAGEGAAAAAAAAAFVKESTRAQRAPFLDALVREVVDGGRARALPYGDHLILLVRLGDDLLARGRQAEAEALLTRARKLRPGGDELRAHAALASEALRLLADAWSARGQIREALDLLDEAREDIAPYLPLVEQARLLNDIGWLQYRLGDYASCVDSCKFAVNTLNPNEHPLVVGQALNLLGVIAFNTSRYDEAVSYYEQSAFLREREHDHNALAGSYNNLALAYQAKGEYDKALEHLYKSIDIKRRQNNEAGLAGGFLNLAFLYLEVHNFDEAERRCRESLRISSALGLAQLVAESHNTLGDIVFTRGQLDEAESYYQRALEHARRLATVNEEMGAQKRLAKLYLRKGRHEDASAAIDEASRLARKVGSKYENAQTEEIFGELRAAEGHHAEAVDRFERAAALYATLSKTRMAAACFAKAGLAQAQTGGTLEAKRYLDRAQDLIKSQIGHEIPEEIITLQQTLRERPLPSGVSGTESQKLLYAFYELSSLSDYADDKGAFFRRIVNVFRDLTGASSCALALQTEEEHFVRVASSGDQEPIEDPALRSLLARALQLGSVLHAETVEAGDLFARVSTPPTTGDERLVVVPMKSMGRDLGCVLLTLPSPAVPRSKDDLNFISCIGRHVAGDLRLSLHLDERSHKEETLERELVELGAPAADRHRFQSLVGRDETMKKVFRIVDKIKDMDTGILIFGESGTGKTELARAIHYNSPRRRHVFQSIHCAEIPTSLLESELFGHERGAFTGAVQRKLGRCEIADGGTVFLDDVNVMPIETQSKLLHYLENKSFMRLGGTQKITTDVRLIAASNEDLERLVKEGRFREDLYYRLKVVQIELPPLRDRQEDMILIAQEFLKKRCQAQGKPLKRLATETIKLFQKYRWPGNVRELQNVLEQIVLLCDDVIVEPASLPDDFLRRAAGGGKQRWQSLEQLVQQMVESGGYSETNPLMPQIEVMLASKMSTFTDNKTRAATLLGITKPTLYSRLRGYDRNK
jgi:DNA-binding NtrC family response regulator/tetratricopeptide (TPR) repeat protein